jgi:hypothetical protein
MNKEKDVDINKYLDPSKKGSNNTLHGIMKNDISLK